MSNTQHCFMWPFDPAMHQSGKHAFILGANSTRLCVCVPGTLNQHYAGRAQGLDFLPTVPWIHKQKISMFERPSAPMCLHAH